MRSFSKLLAAMFVTMLFAYAADTVGQNKSNEHCGLGPPPGSPDFEDYNARQEAERQQRGFLLVCESNLERFDLQSSLRPLEKAMPKLAFKPVDLSSTPFSRYASLGVLTDRPVSGKGDSALYRAFRADGGLTVYLFEWDMSVGGGEILRDPKDEPGRINGLPARLDVMQASSGKAVSMLSWVEGRRRYELWVDANIKLGTGPASLFELAGSIPKSESAQNLEPTRRQFTVGPDGLPKIDFPAVLINGEMIRMQGDQHQKHDGK